MPKTSPRGRHDRRTHSIFGWFDVSRSPNSMVNYRKESLRNLLGTSSAGRSHWGNTIYHPHRPSKPPVYELTRIMQGLTVETGHPALQCYHRTCPRQGQHTRRHFQPSNYQGSTIPLFHILTLHCSTELRQLIHKYHTHLYAYYGVEWTIALLTQYEPILTSREN